MRRRRDGEQEERVLLSNWCPVFGFRLVLQKSGDYDYNYNAVCYKSKKKKKMAWKRRVEHRRLHLHKSSTLYNLKYRCSILGTNRGFSMRSFENCSSQRRLEEEGSTSAYSVFLTLAHGPPNQSLYFVYRSKYKIGRKKCQSIYQQFCLAFSENN